MSLYFTGKIIFVIEAKFCTMKAKEVLNGVAMPDDKIVTDGTVTRTVVDSYIFFATI